MTNETFEEKMKNATVLIVSDKNAVALKYETGVDSAPILVCKSNNIQKSIEIAEKLNIAIQKKSIANDIAHLVKVNNKISPSMYKSIALILAKMIKRKAFAQKIYEIVINDATNEGNVNNKKLPSIYKTIDIIFGIMCYFLYNILSIEQKQIKIPNCVSSEDFKILLENFAEMVLFDVRTIKE